MATITRIWCDVKRSGCHSHGPWDVTPTGARKRAVALGWIRMRKLDICPNCQALQKKK